MTTVIFGTERVVVSGVFDFDTVLPVEKNKVSINSSDAILRRK